MNTIKETVEAYVRSQIPELKDDGMLRCDACEVSYQGRETSHFCETPQRKLNDAKPIQLQHWLRVLEENRYPGIYPSVEVWDSVLTAISAEENSKRVNFNLTTGQPATEADYQAIAEILNIEV